jgi:putative flippase GtrA
VSPAQKLELRRLFTFATVGALNTAVCYAVYAALVDGFAWHHNLALAADYALGAALGFIMHRLATFADRKHLRAAFGKYLAALIASFVLNVAVLDCIVASRLLDPIAAQVPALALVTLASYLLQKHWVFRSHSQEVIPRPAEPAQRRVAA